MPFIERNPSMAKPKRYAKDKQHLEVAWTVNLQKSPLNQTPDQNLTTFCQHYLFPTMTEPHNAVLWTGFQIKSKTCFHSQATGERQSAI